MIIVDEIEIGKGEALFLLLIKVPLSIENLSCNYDLLEINILVHKFINIHGIYVSSVEVEVVVAAMKSTCLMARYAPCTLIVVLGNARETRTAWFSL